MKKDLTPQQIGPVSPTEVSCRKPPCAGCRLPASIDCQHACAYIFGHVNVSEALPLAFNLDKQFSVQIPVLIEGRHYGEKKPRTFWFNSVRCAELFLMAHGYCKGSETAIGNGERLVSFLSGPEITQPRKNRRSLEYKQAQMARRSERTEGSLQPSILGSSVADSKGRFVHPMAV
jgi:hypothetical protein